MPPRKRAADVPAAASASASATSSDNAVSTASANKLQRNQSAATAAEQTKAAVIESSDESEPPKKKSKTNAPVPVDGSNKQPIEDDSASVASESVVEMTDAKNEEIKSDNIAASSSAESSASASASASGSAEEAVDFSGRKFMLMGGFNRGKHAIENMIIESGGTISKTCNKSISYCVCGEPVPTGYGGVSGPGSKAYREVKKAKVTILNENEFLALLEKHKKTKEQQVKDIESGLIPDLSSIVGEYANDEPGVVAEGSLGACWLEICEMIGCIPEKPCSRIDIAKAESEIRRKLPPYLKSLYAAANGADNRTRWEYSSSSSSPHPSELFPCLKMLVDTHTGRNSILNDCQPLFKEMGVLAIWKSRGKCVTVIDLSKGSETNTMLTIDFDDDPHSIAGFATSLEDRIRLYHLLVKKKFDKFQRRFAKEGNGKSELEFMRIIDQERNSKGEAQNETSTVAAPGASSSSSSFSSIVRSIFGSVDRNPVEAEDDEKTTVEGELRKLRTKHFGLKDFEFDQVAGMFENAGNAAAGPSAAAAAAAAAAASSGSSLLTHPIPPNRYLSNGEINQGDHLFLRAEYVGTHKPEITQPNNVTISWTRVTEGEPGSFELEGVYMLGGATGGAAKVRGTGKKLPDTNTTRNGEWKVESYELICGDLFVPCAYEGTIFLTPFGGFLSAPGARLSGEYHGVGSSKAAEKARGQLIALGACRWSYDKKEHEKALRENDPASMEVAVKKAWDLFDIATVLAGKRKKKRPAVGASGDGTAASASSSSSAAPIVIDPEAAAESDFLAELQKLKGGAKNEIAYLQKLRLLKVMRKYERGMYD